jgi:phosphate starvation-inducible protein PhoH
VDESQNLTRDEIKSIVTRLNENNSQILLIGDSKQSDLKKGESGLEWLIEMVEKYDVKGVDFVEFGPEDIVRGGIVKEFVKIFDREGV